MPNARTHDLITVVTAAAATPLVLSSTLPDMNPTNALALVGSYVASGFLFSPDLDLRSAAYRRWGGLRFVWIPYQKLVPHRSWISHSFLLGPLLRILYFTCVMTLLTFVVLAIINAFAPIDPTGTLLTAAGNIRIWIEAHPSVIAYVLVGFVLGGAAHTLTDSIWSWVKRRVNRALRW